MKHRLNLDIKDSNYTLLKEIFKIMDSRKTGSFKNLCDFFNFHFLCSNGLILA